ADWRRAQCHFHHAPRRRCQPGRCDAVAPCGAGAPVSWAGLDEGTVDELAAGELDELGTALDVIGVAATELEAGACGDVVTEADEACVWVPVPSPPESPPRNDVPCPGWLRKRSVSGRPAAASTTVIKPTSTANTATAPMATVRQGMGRPRTFRHHGLSRAPGQGIARGLGAPGTKSASRSRVRCSESR